MVAVLGVRIRPALISNQFSHEIQRNRPCLCFWSFFVEKVSLRRDTEISKNRTMDREKERQKSIIFNWSSPKPVWTLSRDKCTVRINAKFDRFPNAACRKFWPATLSPLDTSWGLPIGSLVLVLKFRPFSSLSCSYWRVNIFRLLWCGFLRFLCLDRVKMIRVQVVSKLFGGSISKGVFF